MKRSVSFLGYSMCVLNILDSFLLKIFVIISRYCYGNRKIYNNDNKPR